MNSSPGSSDHLGAATRLGIFTGSVFPSGSSTVSGNRAVTFLPNRSWVASTARYGPGASLNVRVALPAPSVVKPSSATTLPSSQEFGLDGSGLGSAFLPEAPNARPRRTG